MHLKTILNRIEKHSAFVYERITLKEDSSTLELEVHVRARRGSKAVCSGCARRGVCYDRRAMRRYQHVPLWNIAVFFVYAPRRVACVSCGVRVEQVPWSSGKHRQTSSFAWFLAAWSKRLSWKEVASTFGTSWDTVYRSVEMAVRWGRAHMKLSGIEAIGIDEIAYKKGHHYLTLVYQLDAGARRLLWVGEKRKIKTLMKFFRWLGKERTATLKFICSDMWKPYLKVIAYKAPKAIHVLDRFHIAQHLGKAIDKVRAQEVRTIKANGNEPVLLKMRWCLLKRKENLSGAQAVKLRTLLKANLKSVRAYLLKEDLHQLWTYRSAYWAERFLKSWCTRTLRSRIDPMKKVATMLRRHQPLIINWFHAKGQFSSGAVEGFNLRAKLTSRKAFGFRSLAHHKVALYHTLGNLPEPKLTHRFCG